MEVALAVESAAGAVRVLVFARALDRGLAVLSGGLALVKVLA